MTKPSIVLYKKLPADLHQRLEQHFAITEFDGITDKNRAEVFDALQNAEGLLGSGGKIDKELFDHAPRLRAVSTISVGYDNFDVAELTRRQIPMMHTPTALTDTVADTVMALVLSTARRVVNVAERVKAGEWTENIGESWFGTDVHHKTMGIIGMGRIGLALAQRAHFGFDMPILYNARSQHKAAEERFGARKCELDELLKTSDFVCVLLPMTDETFHLIGKEELAKMKSTAILISAGRGPVIDEQALIDALKANTLYGAGMDVFETEPLPKDSPLLSLPNVVALPHIGSATHETRYDMAACAVDNLIAALKGDVKEFCVNPEVLKK